jgi:hypothetical protein
MEPSDGKGWERDMARAPQRLVRTVRIITGRDPLPATLSPAQRAVLERLRELVMSRAIVGVAVSDKEMEGIDTGEPGIVFYVREKLGRSALDPALLVPPVIFDAQGRSILTDVRAIGEIRAQASIAASPIRSGYSVGHENGAPGTVGAIVRAGGRQHILSAKHVLTNNGAGRAGDRIFYPAPADGGSAPGSVAATLLAYPPYVPGTGYPNAADAALAEIVQGRQVDTAIPGADHPVRLAAPYKGMRVSLSGRTSGTGATSVVKAVNATVELFIDVDFVGFHDQVECSGFTQDGDSGSLVVADSGEVVGLHIAGSGSSSFFTPIAAVRSAVSFNF